MFVDRAGFEGAPSVFWVFAALRARKPCGACELVRRWNLVANIRNLGRCDGTGFRCSTAVGRQPGSGSTGGGVRRGDHTPWLGQLGIYFGISVAKIDPISRTVAGVCVCRKTRAKFVTPMGRVAAGGWGRGGAGAYALEVSRASKQAARMTMQTSHSDRVLQKHGCCMHTPGKGARIADGASKP